MSVSDMGGFHDNKGVFFGQAKKIKGGFSAGSRKTIDRSVDLGYRDRRREFCMNNARKRYESCIPDSADPGRKKHCETIFDTIRRWRG